MKKLLERFVRAGLKPPRTLTLSITNGCNLSCRHCWPESLSESISKPVSEKILFRLIDEFADLGIERINVTGGEPLTHPEWAAILAWCCKQPTVTEVCLQTNAVLLGSAEAHRLAALQGAELSVQVSLDGATAASHDLIRGKGSFEATLAGVHHLRDCGLNRRTVVAFTEMQHNFAELPRLLVIIEELDLGGLVSATLVRTGRAGGTHPLNPPLPAQYEALLQRYRTDSGFRRRYEKLANIAAIEWYKDTEAEDSGCGWACGESLYVTADGRLYPCPLLQDERFQVRDIHERSMAGVMAEALSSWCRLPEIGRRRSAELKACRCCPGRRHCAGGCPGRAHAAHGSVMTVEDRCELRKAVYAYQPGE